MTLIEQRAAKEHRPEMGQNRRFWPTHMATSA